MQKSSYPWNVEWKRLFILFEIGLNLDNNNLVKIYNVQWYPNSVYLERMIYLCRRWRVHEWYKILLSIKFDSLNWKYMYAIIVVTHVGVGEWCCNWVGLSVCPGFFYRYLLVPALHIFKHKWLVGIMYMSDIAYLEKWWNVL